VSGRPAARAAGFDNLCADLMFGLPEQTMADWRASLAALLALAPAHITAYALTVEAGTRFGALERAGKLARPGDEQVAAEATSVGEPPAPPAALSAGLNTVAASGVPPEGLLPHPVVMPNPSRSATRPREKP